MRIKSNGEEIIMAEDNTRIQQAYAYCRELTIKADSNFSLGFRFLSEQKRNAIYAVYAFNRRADDFVDEGDDKSKKQELIEKWDMHLDECYEGKNIDHPILVAFADAVKRYNIPKKPFKDAIAGFKMDLEKNRYNDFEELKKYCCHVAGTISLMSLCVFGFTDKKAYEYGDDLSMALQLTNIIRDVGKDIEKDRIYIPFEEMKKFNYSEEELLSKTYNDNFVELMKFQVERAKSYFQRAQNLIPLLEKDARFTVLLMGAVYVRVLKKVEKNDYEVFNKFAYVSKIKKALLVLKTKINRSFF